MVTEILTYLMQVFFTLPYKDLIEIFFFSTVMYYVLVWLSKDTEKNLLLSFYGYCFLFFVAHYGDFPVIRFTLFMTAPAVALIFIIMHQQTLQKNFVFPFKSSPTPSERHHWIDELMKCCLMALNQHREIILVIERNDHLKSLIHAPYFIYAELKKDVFDILLEKHIPNNEYMIWINQQGKLVAINGIWRTEVDEAWLSKEAQNMHMWKQHALFITSRTDAIMFKVNPLTRSFDLVIAGQIQEGISAEQAALLLKKNFRHATLSRTKVAGLDQKQPPSEKML